MIKSLAEKARDGRLMAPDDRVTSESFPFLWELLTLDVYADGTLRILPVIRITRTSGGFKVTLQDHETCLEWSVVVFTLEQTWRALEHVLSSAQPGTTFKSMINRTKQPFSLRKKKS